MTARYSSTAAGLWLMAGALALVVGSPARLLAQQHPPLAEVARKEAERRKTSKGTQKVITGKDLPESARKPVTPPAPGTAAAGGSATDAAGGQKPAEGPKPEAAQSPQQNEAYWRGRLASAQEAVRRSEAFAEALQSRINGLTTDFVNRDDPYQRAKIGEDRQKALAELDRVKAEVEQGKKLIADIEEEARKAGVPAGWLR